MRPASIIVKADEYQDYAWIYPNIAEQVDKVLPIMKDIGHKRAMVFLTLPDSNKYFPAMLERTRNSLRLTPQSIIHGVRKHEHLDPFEVLMRILAEGFRTKEHLFKRNSYILPYNPDGPYREGVDKADYSYLEHTCGDRYVLDIGAAVLENGLPSPFLLQNNWKEFYLRAAEAKDIKVAIKLKDRLRMDFYREHIPSVRFIPE